MHALSGRGAKRARRRAPGRALAVPPGVIEVTEARLGPVHLVTHEAVAAGARYVALCGREVLPASPTAHQRRSCPLLRRLVRGLALPPGGSPHPPPHSAGSAG
jgi:hypothetical protein